VNILLIETKLASSQTLQLVQGDITIEATDAIVNAANERLQHEGGVAWSISRRGGPAIQAESDAWVRTRGPARHDAPAWTSGGDLACRYVIHAVGPVWGETEEAEAKLAAAVTGSLRVADELGLESVAMPAISTGIFGFPKELAAGVILSAIRKYFETPSGLERVRLVLLDAETVSVFEKAWHDQFGAEP
jgi:O-acetyl-ADP-ribose deacetylase (regulator of RNase III)